MPQTKAERREGAWKRFKILSFEAWQAEQFSVIGATLKTLDKKVLKDRKKAYKGYVQRKEAEATALKKALRIKE